MSTLPPVRPTLDDCGQRIDAKYNELSHSLGWRFLGGPRRTFNGSTLFAIITLNPGGYAEDPAHPRLSSEAGSSYWIESWRGRRSGAAPLQRQVQELFVRIAGIVGATESAREFVESHVLVAHFVPFRSPNLEALHRRKESIAFARSLWSDILAAWMPRVILTIDRVAFKELHTILLDKPGMQVADRREFPTGWGNARMEAACFREGHAREHVLMLARLPHLSRFKLFSNEQYRQPVQQLLNYVFGPGPFSSQTATTEPLTATTATPINERLTTPIEGGSASAPSRPNAETSPRRDASPPIRRIDPVSAEGIPRLTGIEGADLYPDWEEFIRDQDTRCAVRLLVSLGVSSRRLVPAFRWHGRIRSCKLYWRSGERTRPPYSFTINQRWLLFYFRLREVRSSREGVRPDFVDSFHSNTKGEWTVKLRTVDDVRRLTAHVAL